MDAVLRTNRTNQSSGANSPAPPAGSIAPALEATIELEHAIGFSGKSIGGLFYHPNGQHAVFAAAGTVVIASLTDPHDQVFLRGHDDDITALHLSPDGSMIASGQKGSNSDVLVWSFDTKALLYRLSEHDHGISAVAFSHDSRLLASVGASSDRRLFIWDTSTGYIVASTAIVPPQPTNITWGGYVRDVKRRPTDHYLLASCGDSNVSVWDLDPRTGVIKPEKLSAGQSGAVVRKYNSVTFTPDGETLFGSTDSGDFCTFNIKHKSLMTNIQASARGVTFIAPLSTGQHIVVGGGDGSLRLFQGSAATWKTIGPVVPLKGAVTSISASADEREILVGTATSFVYRIPLDYNTGMGPAQLWMCAHHGHVTDVAYPTGVSDRFATASADGTVRVWDASTYCVVAEQTYRGSATPTSVVYAGEMVLTSWNDGTIRSFDSLTSEDLWTLEAHREAVTSLVVSHNMKFMVTGSENGEIRVWELRSREMIVHFKEHRSRVTSLRLFPDDTHMLSCARDRSFILWDLRNEKRVSSHTQRQGGINRLVLVPDQQRVLTVGPQVTYWDLSSVEPSQIISPAHEEDTESLALSNDGRVFATGGAKDATVKLWDFATGTLLTEGTGHSGPIASLSFSPDDRQLLSVGEDGNIFIWNCYRE